MLGLTQTTVKSPVEAATLPAARPADKGASSGRYQSLDLWRGAACLMLVFYHTTFHVENTLEPRNLSTWTAAGVALKAATLLWVGVPIFFVISGYCIAASVASLRRRSCSLREFFGRRVRRIYPPLWIASIWAVVAVWAIATLWPELYRACLPLPRWEQWSLWSWLGNLTATESWHHHVTGGRPGYLMLNTWTLCFEEQFYAIVGVMLFLAAGRFVTASLLLCAVTLAFRHGARAAGYEMGGLFLEGHWLLFAAGILVHYQLQHATRRQWWAIMGLYVAGLIYAVVDRSRWAPSEHERHIDEYLFIACLFALALVGLRRWDSAIVKARVLGLFKWSGQRSYSIYLTHFPVVVALSCWLSQVGVSTPAQWLFFTLPLCLATALCTGWIFYVLVERHFQNTSSAKVN